MCSQPLRTPSSLQITPGTWILDVSARTWRPRLPSPRSITSTLHLRTSRRCCRGPTVTRPSLPETPACTAGWSQSPDLAQATSATPTTPLPSTATCGQRCSPTLATAWTVSPTSPSRLTSPALPRWRPLWPTLRPAWHPDPNPIWGFTIRLQASEASPPCLRLRPPRPALLPHWPPEAGQTFRLCTKASRGHRCDLSQPIPPRAPSGIHPFSTKRG